VGVKSPNTLSFLFRLFVVAHLDWRHRLGYRVSDCRAAIRSARVYEGKCCSASKLRSQESEQQEGGKDGRT
jgi:hypothetical protein